MVQQTPQSRLLNNLLKSTKEYTSSLTSHLIVSHTSLSALQAYASASSPATVGAIFGVAEALQGADDALVRYAQQVDHWRERLKEVRTAEEEVANILRDREILVTRLIKASSKKPTKDSVMNGPSSPSASVLSLNNPNSSGQSSHLRLTSAQAELQGCEKQLAEKQRQLDQIRSLAIRDGLEQRCHALIALGNVLAGKGHEGVRALQDGYAATGANGALPNGNAVPPIDVSELFRNLPPRPGSPAGMSDTSLAPSQSASQLGSPSSYQPRSYAQLGAGANGSRRNIIDESASSEDDEQGEVQVVENKRRSTHQPPPTLAPPRASFHAPQPHRGYSSDLGPAGSSGPAKPSALRRASMQRQTSTSTAGGSEPKKRSGFFGAIGGLFRSSHSKNSPSKDYSGNGSGAAPPSSPLRQSNTTWQTRTDRNIAIARGETRGDGSSDEEDTRKFVAVDNRPKKLTVPAGNAAAGASTTALSRSGTKKSTKGGVGPITTTAGAAARSSSPPRGGKLQRSSSTSKVPASNAPAKKTRTTNSALGTSSATPSSATITPAPPVPAVPESLMRAESTKSKSKGSRTRTTSLPSAAAAGGVVAHHGPPDAPPPRNVARGKPLKLTGPVEKDPNAWVHHNANAPSSAPAHQTESSHHRSTSIRSSTSIASAPAGAAKGRKSGTGAHKRAASLDVKAPPPASNTLMTLVEDVVSDRQRAEAIRPFQAPVSNSAAPRMMLPSEYMKASTPAHGYGVAGSTAAASRSHAPIMPPVPTAPTFVVNPPTPGVNEHHTNPHFPTSSPNVKGKGRESERRTSLEPSPKHSPPPRSASPLRSAMRQSTSNHTATNAAPPALPPPKFVGVTAPPPVVLPREVPIEVVSTSTPAQIAAPTPVRPNMSTNGSANRMSASLDSDAASAYETAASESEGSEDDGSSTDGVATPTRVMSPVVTAMGLADLTPTTNSHTTATTTTAAAASTSSPPSTVSQGGTEMGSADGANVQRRKSVRLDVPPTPEMPSFSHDHGSDDDDDANKPVPPPKRHSTISTTSTTPRKANNWSSRIADPDNTPVRDVWAAAASDSDEDADYKRARRALNKAQKHEKEAHAEAAMIVAVNGPVRKKSSKRKSGSGVRR